MALKKETITNIAKLLKLDEAKVIAALAAADEQDIEIQADLQVLTKTELETRDRAKYGEGKTAGEEMLVKGIMDEEGITVEAGKKKDKAALVEGLKKKATDEAGTSTDEKVKERDKTIAALRQNLTTKEAEVNTFKSQADIAKKDAQLLALLPKNRADNLTDEQYLLLFKSEFEITEHEGKQAVKNLKTGDIVKTTTDLTPIAPADVIKTQFSERKWIKEEAPAPAPAPGKGGRGAGDSNFKPAGIANMKQFNDHLKAQGINPNGSEAKTLLTQVTAANTNFDYTVTAD